MAFLKRSFKHMTHQNRWHQKRTNPANSVNSDPSKRQMGKSAENTGTRLGNM